MKAFDRFFKLPQKKKLADISFEYAMSINPPKTNEYKTMLTLLDDVERWHNVGDKELEKKIWQMIAEKASLYSEGMKEKYNQ